MDMLFKYFLIYAVSFIGIFIAMLFLLTLFENRKRLNNPPPMEKLPFVSIIVPTFNGSQHITKAVESLLDLEYPKNLFEILIVNDGSTDNTFKIAQKLEKQYSQVRAFTKENGGKASALNFGIKKAKGSIIAALDDDSIVTPSALMKMIGYFADPKVASVTPSLAVYRPDGFLRKVQHAEYLFSIFLRKVFAFMNMIHVTPGPFSLYRKSFFDRYGGFDEKDATEDTEIAFRIQSKQLKIENSMDAIVYTVSPNKLSVLLKQRTRWYSGLIRDCQKYPQLFNPRYGYLALISLPFAFISVIILIAMIGYFTYINIDSFIHTIQNWFLVGFDLLPMLKNFKLDYLYYELTSPVTAFLLVALLLNILFVIIAKYGSKTKESIKISYLYFFAVYSYLYAFWWIMTFVYRLFGGRISWGKQKYK